MTSTAMVSGLTQLRLDFGAIWKATGIESLADFDSRVYGSKAKNKFVDGHGCT